MLTSLFNNLYSKDLITICQTNPDYSTICQDPTFWKNRTLRDYNISTATNVSWQQLYYDLSFQNALPIKVLYNNKILGTTFQYPKKSIQDALSLFLSPLNKSLNDFTGLELLLDQDENVLSIIELPYSGDIVETRNYSNDKVASINIITTLELVDQVLLKLS